MTNYIAILEDESDREMIMRKLLAESFASFELALFDNAPDMIEWLAESMDNVNLISLDHDLGPNRVRDGKVFDPGTGRDVVDYIITRIPVCPVIIHTTNYFGGDGMKFALQDNGWQNHRIIPYNDLTWISKDWIYKVKELLAK